MTLAFERLSPRQACKRFSDGIGRPVKYVRGPIDISVHIPSGYREHLEALQETLGEKRAPYFGPGLEYPKEARSLWEGWRGLEEYAREVFEDEEAANGLTWMDEPGPEFTTVGEDDPDDENSVSSTRPHTPATATPTVRTPFNHPEGYTTDFFVGSC